jgi:hypothetical protein
LHLLHVLPVGNCSTTLQYNGQQYVVQNEFACPFTESTMVTKQNGHGPHCHRISSTRKMMKTHGSRIIAHGCATNATRVTATGGAACYRRRVDMAALPPYLPPPALLLRCRSSTLPFLYPPLSLSIYSCFGSRSTARGGARRLHHLDLDVYFLCAMQLILDFLDKVVKRPVVQCLLATLSEALRVSLLPQVPIL